MFVEYSSSPKTDSLEHPNNVFEMQNKMSNNLNSFQNHYGRYLRCQNEDTAKSVDPPCDFVGRDSFSELQNAYKNLMDDLTEIENVYEKQSDYNAKTVKVFNENEEQLNVNYKTLKKERKHLDQQLKTLQEYSDTNISPENRRLKSVNLINTLLIIAAVYLIYVIFVDL
jgi:uncharacterized protein YukE